ncbi:hypothetical protein CYLTODRAFT_392345 [Cylindrobasidium torrendii FP15055 ss-10]|uniref:Uncharacterized protein n=1 Tax=Cylindrobasidium torrendii FP15055 ss-10 TaxID=1314674 RepID=A0A0D7BI42_9AGAR|nr:hypothetical protein CYLTODRAFT_392345 [Cylindrobasidium torrendii FP15055 ss-10]
MMVSPTLPWTNSPMPPTATIFTKRYSRVALLGLMSIITVFFFFWHAEPLGLAIIPLKPAPNAPQEPLHTDTNNTLPPTFDEWHNYEAKINTLPKSRYIAEGPTLPLIHFSNHAHGSGWGNIMQELLMNAHLAQAAGYGFVFDNYTWSKDMTSPFGIFNGKAIPGRIPLTALVAGPVVGANDQPAVSLPQFTELCNWKGEGLSSFKGEPNPNIYVLESEPLRATIGERGQMEGKDMLYGYVKELTRLKESGVQCVVVKESSLHMWDIWLFGDTHALSLMPYIRNSPVFTQFAWSPLILSLFWDNQAFFRDVRSKSWWEKWFGKEWDSLPAPVDPNHPHPIPIPAQLEAGSTNPPYTLLEGLLALHIRRGDFEEHCANLAAWGSRFNGFNSFPELPDTFTPPDGDDDRKAYAHSRCFPSVQDILQKVTSLRQIRKLDRVYVMSNGSPAFLQELKDELAKLGGWKDGGVRTSRDLTWSRREGKYVAQAMDMYVAQRADVFVGNGFSSLTSNVVLLRMINGVDPITTRHW